MAIYYGKQTPESQVFDEALIPRPQTEQVAKTFNKKDHDKRVKKLQDNIDYKNKKARKAEQQIVEQAKANKALMEQLAQAQAETAALKQAREQATDINTAHTPRSIRSRNPSPLY